MIANFVEKTEFILFFYTLHQFLLTLKGIKNAQLLPFWGLKNRASIPFWSSQDASLEIAHPNNFSDGGRKNNLIEVVSSISAIFQIKVRA